MTRRNLFSYLGKSVVAGAAAAVASQLPAEAKPHWDCGVDKAEIGGDQSVRTIGYYNPATGVGCANGTMTVSYEFLNEAGQAVDASVCTMSPLNRGCLSPGIYKASR